MRRLAQRLREHDWFAAGIELVVVIAGILIALQVDNWNQARSDAQRARAYIERIRADLQTDLRFNANRERFMAQVARYGEQTLAHAETGALVDGSAWKTVLAYFQAGQFYSYSRDSITFREMRDTGDLGLIRDAKLRSHLAFYYEGSANAHVDNMVMNLVPQYRQDIRSVTPMPVQDYIWANCFREIMVDKDQQMFDCPSPVSDAEARAILADFAQRPELARDLRYWLSNQRVASLLWPDDRKFALELVADLQREMQLQ